MNYYILELREVLVKELEFWTKMRGHYQSKLDSDDYYGLEDAIKAWELVVRECDEALAEIRDCNNILVVSLKEYTSIYNIGD